MLDNDLNAIPLKKSLLLFISSCLLTVPICATASTIHDIKPTGQQKIYGFIDAQSVINDLSGDFEAQVRFIQNQTAAPNNNQELNQQDIVSDREALLVITPAKDINPTNIDVSIFMNGELQSNQQMTSPEEIQPTDRTSMDERKNVVYSTRSFTLIIPWTLMHKGLSLSFNTNDGKTGELTDDQIDFSVPAHIEFPIIRIGMLTKPPKPSALELKTANFGSQLFQRFPIATATFSHYLPIQLDKIVMPNGAVKTEYSDYSNPSVYSGDLREDIAKSLIQLGIDNADFGITSSAPWQWQPAFYPSIVIGQARGRYRNKDGNIADYSHGLSGGNGMVLLLDTLGNETTHEIGHALGLSHYPGGYAMATHSQKSGWGYDAYRQYMADNLNWWHRVKGSYHYGNIQVTPFKDVYAYGTDPMGGGQFDSSISSYPLFTDYSSRLIQQGLEKSNYIDLNSASGYAHWSEKSEEMQPTPQKLTDANIEKTDVEVMTMVGYYDPKNELTSYIYPPLYGSSGNIYQYPSVKTGDCWAQVNYIDGSEESIPLAGKRFSGNLSNKFHFNLERDRIPENITINCPIISSEDVAKKQLLKEYRQDRFYSWGENNRHGTPGDIFAYNRNGRVEIYKLNAGIYWYFPSSGQSSGTWTFMGYLDELIKEKVAQITPQELGMKVIDSRDIEENNEHPANSVTIGQGRGYKEGIDSSSNFANNERLLKHKNFATFSEFSYWVLSDYHSLALSHDLNTGEKRRGAIYEVIDENTGKHHYFLMLDPSASALPNTFETNNDWKYLGDAETYINFSFNPVRLDRHQANDIDKIISDYFNQNSLLQWQQRNGTSWAHLAFAVFVDKTENSIHHYYIQRTPGKGDEYPALPESNKDWIYLGDSASLKKYIDSLNANRNIFEDEIVKWYKQDNIMEWSDNRTGKANDIYRYDFHDGKRHYFQLKTNHYGYFPLPNADMDVSNSEWKYLGCY